MFRIKGDVFHEESCKCGCCDPITPAMWAVYGTFLDHDPEAARRVMKAHEDELERPIDDPFLALELQLAAILAHAFGARAAQIRQKLEKVFESPVDLREVDEVLEEVREVMGDVVDERTERNIAELVNRLIISGVRTAEGTPQDEEDLTPVPTFTQEVEFEDEEQKEKNLLLAGFIAGGVWYALRRKVVVGQGTFLEGAPSVALIHQGIVDSAKYYTNTYFNRIILPLITARVDSIIAGTPTGGLADFKDIHSFIDARFRSVPYWRVVANAAASRAYHYGIAKAADLRQRRAYRIDAVIDSRTTDICLAMDGQVFWLADAVNLLEKVAQASPEEVRELMPFIENAAEVRGKTAAELRALGHIMPPFHFNCRSTIQFI